MKNENKEESFYLMMFYLGGDCNTDFSELNIVSIRSKTIERLAEKLKLINNFRENVFNINLYKCIEGKLSSLSNEISITFEQLENLFKEMGVKL